MVVTPVSHDVKGMSQKTMSTRCGWCHFGVGAPPILEPILVVGLGFWTHGHLPRSVRSIEVQDWEPKDRNALALRVHYLARASGIRSFDLRPDVSQRGPRLDEVCQFQVARTWRGILVLGEF